jgi:hypothetical protein
MAFYAIKTLNQSFLENRFSIKNTFFSYNARTVT